MIEEYRLFISFRRELSIHMIKAKNIKEAENRARDHLKDLGIPMDWAWLVSENGKSLPILSNKPDKLVKPAHLIQ